MVMHSDYEGKDKKEDGNSPTHAPTTFPYHHDFTDDELDEMLYLWDHNATSIVNEYLYMLQRWKKHPPPPQPPRTVPSSSLSSIPPPDNVVELDDRSKNDKQNLRKSYNNEEDGRIDTGKRTKVDHFATNGEDVNLQEEPEFVYLDELDTDHCSHVVEFYSPTCPHCQHFKSKYIQIANETIYRAASQRCCIQFHAVSCDLYPMICRAYSITGFPFIMGFRVGSNIRQRGIELNPINEETGEEDEPISPETIARNLNVTLGSVSDGGTSSSFSRIEYEKSWKSSTLAAAKEAADVKRSWHEYNSTIDERYHNAAMSLLFVLKNGIHIQNNVHNNNNNQQGSSKGGGGGKHGNNGINSAMDDMRAIALKEFMELLDWTLPQYWIIRTGLIRDLLHNMSSIISSKNKLDEIVNYHVSILESSSRRRSSDTQVGHNQDLLFWGGLQSSIEKKNVKNKDSLPSSSLQQLPTKSLKWSQACTHRNSSIGSNRGGGGGANNGYTCGLWTLFHIITVGSSVPMNQMYGYLSGYVTSSTDVNEIIKRFIQNFFSCDICRYHYVKNYNDCGQNHCERLPTIMPILLVLDDKYKGTSTATAAATNDPNFELALWFNEMHNTVNVRIAKENAERNNGNSHREVTDEEQLSSIFPTTNMCPNCWRPNNDSANTAKSLIDAYNRSAMKHFLKNYYWPNNYDYHLDHDDDEADAQSLHDVQFQNILQRRLTQQQQRNKQHRRQLKSTSSTTSTKSPLPTTTTISLLGTARFLLLSLFLLTLFVLLRLHLRKQRLRKVLRQTQHKRIGKLV